MSTISPLADRAFSLYLDTWRFIAAITVVIAHMNMDGFDFPLKTPNAFSHEAVIVFFVLSGLVIAHSTFEGGRDWKAYLFARASRLYAVVLPAIALSLACAALVGKGWTAWDLVSSLLFLNEVWLNPAKLPLNGPFWSLCFEAFYYTLFGIWIFAKGPARYVAFAIVAVAAGPAILALSPAWLCGVWLYYNAHKISLRGNYAVAIISLGLIFVIVLSGATMTIRAWMFDLTPYWYVMRQATRIVTDIIIAGLFTVHLLAVRNIVPEILTRYASTVRYLAGGTFTIYLFHRPIMQAFDKPGYGPLASIATFVAIVGFCLLISGSLEKKLTRILRERLPRISFA